MKRVLAAVAALATLTAPVWSQASAQNSAAEAEPVRIMVLGAYHFGNPGLDLNNAEADDVLSDQRQAELEALTEALLAFQPTVLAVEQEADAPYDYAEFANFSEEMLRSNRNEQIQIGFRLAAAAGIDRVYAVDERPRQDGETSYFPWGPVRELAQETGRHEELAGISDASAMIAQFEAMQETASIPELLMFMNGPDFTDQFYWDVITFGDGENQAGAELAGRWFMRNAKIFNKIQQVTQPGDRVVVVFGAGHSHWLREIADRALGYELEPVTPYLERAAAAIAGE